MPLRGELMLGIGHTVAGGKTQDYEYLRIEPRVDGIYYVAAPSRQKEAAFRLAEPTKDGSDEIFTFANPAHDFPRRSSTVAEAGAGSTFTSRARSAGRNAR
jgi:hypothetical protein